jgi:hypothetical protein
VAILARLAEDALIERVGAFGVFGAPSSIHA